MVDLEAHESNCQLGLFVAQDDHALLNVKNNGLGIIKSKMSVYPYAMYDIELEDIDKQENTKGELISHLNIIKCKLQKVNINDLSHKLFNEKNSIDQQKNKSIELIELFENPILGQNDQSNA